MTCPEGRYRKVTISALNGKLYDVCLYWWHYDLTLPEPYMYVYPDRIDVEGGYLKKDSMLVNRYNFIAVNPKKTSEDKVGKDKNGNGPNGSGSDQLVSGIDNSTLLLIGAGILLLIKD